MRLFQTKFISSRKSGYNWKRHLCHVAITWIYHFLTGCRFAVTNMNKAAISEEPTLTPVSSLYHLMMAGVIIRLSERRGAIWVLQSLGDEPESTRTHHPFCYCSITDCWQHTVSWAEQCHGRDGYLQGSRANIIPYISWSTMEWKQFSTLKIDGYKRGVFM